MPRDPTFEWTSFQGEVHIIAKAMFDKGKRYKEILIVDRDKKVQKNLKSFFRSRSDNGCKTYDSFTQFCRKGF